MRRDNRENRGSLVSPHGLILDLFWVYVSWVNQTVENINTTQVAALSYKAVSANDRGALTGFGIERLLRKIGEILYETYTPVYVFLPFQEGSLISGFHEFGKIEDIEDVRGGVRIKGRLPGRLLASYKAFEVLEKTDEPTTSSEDEPDDRLV